MCPSRQQIYKALDNPQRALQHFLFPPVMNTSTFLTSRLGLGTNIFERDWDVHVILDCCRMDALKAVAHEYEFLSNVEHVWSVGGSSAEWMVHTFDKQWDTVLSNTAYVTSNAWAKRVIDDQLHPNKGFRHNDLLRLRRFGNCNVIRSERLGRLEHVWRYVSSEDKIHKHHDVSDELIAGGAPPRYVTDRGIDIIRDGGHERTILHYTQPHRPYLASGFFESRDLREYETKPFAYLRGGGDYRTVWEAYLNDLRWVLDDVTILLQNIEAETVVISADHGEAFGEYGVYGHSAGSVHPHVRRVPWVTTTATDTGSYSPKVTTSVDVETSAGENLEALGYL